MRFVSFAITVLVLTTSACKGTVSSEGTALRLEALEISPAAPVLAAGFSTQLTATGTYSDGSAANLTSLVVWSADGTHVAVDSLGSLTALSAGTANVSATLGKVTASVTLVVTEATLLEVAITPASPVLPDGETVQLQATAAFSDESTLDVTSSVTWTSANPAVATVSGSGLLSGVSPGPVEITAAVDSISATALATVVGATLESLSVTAESESVALGLSAQMSAVGTFSNGEVYDLTSQVAWSSDGDAVTIDSRGLATSHQEGTVAISATFGDIVGTTDFTVVPAVVVAVMVAPPHPVLADGTELQLRATAVYSNGADVDVTGTAGWVSTDGAVATVDADGLLTAEGSGACNITASFGGQTAVAELTVTAAKLTAIAVTPATPEVPLGLTIQLGVTGTYTDGTHRDLTTAVSWSSDAASASVDPLGRVSADALGVANITASLDGLSDSTSVTVTGEVVVALEVLPTAPVLADGRTVQLVSEAIYSDGSRADVTASSTWQTQDVAVATVDATGMATAVDSGQTLTSASFDGAEGFTWLTVTSAALDAITVSPDSPTLAAGLSQQMTATGTYSDGSQQNITSIVTWASDAAAATIDAGGLAIAALEGAANISATLGDVTGQTAVTVSAAEVTAVEVTPAFAVVADNGSQQLMATAHYTDGSGVDVTHEATWASSDNAIATVDTAGLATAVSAGPVDISAAFAGHSGSAALTVNPPTVQSLTVEPASAVLLNSEQVQLTVIGTYTDGAQFDLTHLASFASSAANILSVSAAGLATASDSSIGSATVTASYGGQSAQAQLRVRAVTALAMEPSTPTIADGTSLQLRVAATYSDNVTQEVTDLASWASLDSATVDVSADGVVSAVAVGGPAGVTATYSGLTIQADVTVSAATLTSMAIEPPEVLAFTNRTRQFSVIGTFSDGSTQDLTDQVTWSSGDAAIAVVSNSDIPGLLWGEAVATGSAGQQTTISASHVQLASPVSAIFTVAAADTAYLTRSDVTTVLQYTIDADGALVELDPASFDAGGGTGTMAISPWGVFAYADFGTSGIAQFRINPDGSLATLTPGLFVPSVDVATLAMHPSGRYLFAFGGGEVLSFAIDDAGQLSEVSCSGLRDIGGEQMLIANPNGKAVYATSWTGGSVYQYQVQQDGCLEAYDPAAERPTGMVKPQGIGVHPNGDYVYALTYNTVYGTPMGIFSFVVNFDGSITTNSPKVTKMNGAARLVVHPDGDYAWGSDVSGTIHSYRVQDNGVLLDLGSSVSGWSRLTNMEVDPTGSFLFALDTGGYMRQLVIETDGTLSENAAGSFALQHSFQWLALTP